MHTGSEVGGAKSGEQERERKGSPYQILQLFFTPVHLSVVVDRRRLAQNVPERSADRPAGQQGPHDSSGALGPLEAGKVDGKHGRGRHDPAEVGPKLLSASRRCDPGESRREKRGERNGVREESQSLPEYEVEFQSMRLGEAMRM